MTSSTYLLDDTPALEDQLTPVGEGGHERIARAMAELIRSEEHGGRLIGLEGRWGSGKSTVINLMRKRLERNEHTTTFVFDAWAHERDPLRRSFLESLIRHFRDKRWVEPTHWNDVLERFAKRQTTTKTTTVSDTTRFGKVLALFALPVPLGAALLAGSIQQGVTFRLSPEPNVLFILGVLLSGAPLWVVLARLARKHWRRFRGKDVDLWSGWEVLTGNVKRESTQNTWETPEPTSVEFGDEFKCLMHDALSNSNSKRTVIVLDNLDRVAADDALKIWSTLQTFLHNSSFRNTAWFKRVWIVVPYDKTSLGRLWTSERTAKTADIEPVLDDVSESFVDKTFQIRFEVPPPVLSNWKDYLSQLVCKALPANDKDARDVCRIYNDQIVKQSGAPTEVDPNFWTGVLTIVLSGWAGPGRMRSGVSRARVVP